MVVKSEKLVSNPVVSVVIATYNQKDFIKQTVESVIGQETTFPFEIVIGDDGSTDGQRDLLRSLQEKYPEKIKLVFNDTNLWVTKNYINAIRESRGTYIAPLDGDDLYIDHSKLQKQYDIISSRNDISNVIVGYQNFDTVTGKILSVNNNWNSPVSFDEDNIIRLYNYLTYNFPYFPISSVAFFRREDYLNGCQHLGALIEDDLSTGEETLLNVILCKCGKFYCIKEVMLGRRVQPTSIMSFNSKEKKINFFINRVFHLYLAATLVGLTTNDAKMVACKALDSILFEAFNINMVGYFKMELLKKNEMRVAGMIPKDVVCKYTSTRSIVSIFLFKYIPYKMKRLFNKLS